MVMDKESFWYHNSAANLVLLDCFVIEKQSTNRVGDDLGDGGQIG